MKEKQAVKILVVGPSHSGKSTIARLIEEALASHHIELKMLDTDDFNPVAAFKGKTIPAVVEKTRVEIEIRQTRRVPEGVESRVDIAEAIKGAVSMALAMGTPKEEVLDQVTSAAARLRKAHEEELAAEHDDPCPECGAQLKGQPRGGVKCSNPECGYWFCY